MDFNLIYIILPCFCSIGLHNACAQSQNFVSEEGYYSDYQLDYYPHFHAGMDVEFHLVFKSVFNSCGYPIAEVEQISGSLMRITGIPPKEWEGRARFRVLIDENGNIIDISFWGTPLQEDVKSCFISKIKEYRINPALINLSPVKSKFTYLLIEQAQESNKKKQKKSPITSAPVNGGYFLTKVYYLETDSHDSKAKCIESPLPRARDVMAHF